MTDQYVTAFEGNRRIAAGLIADVALAIKGKTVLVFDDVTGGQIEIDTSGSDADILKRLKKESRGPGRPKIGVTAREVTLLPRHWDWLNEQAGGASAAIRRLVDEARKSSGKDAKRNAQTAAYRFMTAMAGNEADYEEAVRALFAGKLAEMEKLIDPWPGNIRDHIRRLALPAF